MEPSEYVLSESAGPRVRRERGSRRGSDGWLGEQELLWVSGGQAQTDVWDSKEARNL